MTTAPSESTSTMPPKLDVRETEMLGTRVRAACFDALACSDMNYSAAGITFERDGRFTKAKHSGFTVVSMMGRFSKGQLLQALRRNIADSARAVASDVFDQLKRDLKLPRGHVIGFDVAASLHQVEHRGSRRLTAHVFRPPGAVCRAFYGEINIDLYACQAQISLKEGELWGDGSSLLNGENLNLQADTYSELCVLIAEAFNRVTSPQLLTKL
ncbi:hypothetical protein H8F21_13490 [Pseudomonas sp. P66]|uniref:Uncharacterized protein n=1 Tax=Pseudomonas arcuscaelestis TaxID=2710591 RepID=A0ABS2BY81_9PSED|nr:hypothetical protein [Pseudomonas arcuscaelestis]MBM5458577.1 hypothetical protein [Pseudomonas arcuscaelestis]